MVGALHDASRTPGVPEGGAGGVFAGGFEDVLEAAADEDAGAEPESECDEPPPSSHPLARSRAPSARQKLSRRRIVMSVLMATYRVFARVRASGFLLNWIG